MVEEKSADKSKRRSRSSSSGSSGSGSGSSSSTSTSRSSSSSSSPSRSPTPKRNRRPDERRPVDRRPDRRSVERRPERRSVERRPVDSRRRSRTPPRRPGGIIFYLLLFLGRRSPSPIRRRRPASPERKRRSRTPPRESVKSRLFVRNLSRNLTKDHLSEIFGIYGNLKSCEMPMDRIHTHLCKGYGYVEYEKVEDAENAIKHMDGGQIDGLKIQCELSRSY